MEITLSKPQAEFFTSTGKATCAVAGFGSGKTEVAMFRMISSAIEHPTGDWLYTAPTIPLIRDILWAKLEKFLPAIGINCTLNKSESIVYLHGLGKIFCRSMDNPDRLVGFEVVDAFMDELDILSKEKALAVFRKVKARCRQRVKVKKNGYKLNQQWVTTTPEGFRATYELFKKNPQLNSKLVQMSTHSNAHNLPDDYIDDLKASYPPQLIEAYLNGEFVNLNAFGVWVGFDEEKNHYSVDINKGEDLVIGQDFNVGRGCAVIYVWRVIKGKRCLVAGSEVYNSFDTPDTIRVLKERFPHEDFPQQIVYPDATGKSRKSVNASISDIALMRHHKYQIRQPNVNPTIKDRVSSANAAFCDAIENRNVYVDTAKCPNYTEALIQQAYDKNGLPEKGLGAGDDLTDAGTYPIHYLFPLRHNRMYVQTVGGL